MKSIIIGSAALKHWFPDYHRVPMDTDVIISIKDFAYTIAGAQGVKSQKVNQDSAIVKWEGISRPVEYLFSDGTKSFEGLLERAKEGQTYASLDVLYSLKKGHIHFPIKFNKHIKDFMFMRQKLREQLDISLEDDLNFNYDKLDSCHELTENHFKATELRRGKLRTPKMNQTSEEFFGKSKKFVKSYYDHDTMHLAMAHEDKPMYFKILKDGSQVETDEVKWSELTLQQKIQCVLEEVYVIALERKILPDMFGDSEEEWTPKEAFDWALMRVCTTLCDGFFRWFSVKAYDVIQQNYNTEYVQQFFTKISAHDIQDKPSA